MSRDSNCAARARSCSRFCLEAGSAAATAGVCTGSTGTTGDMAPLENHDLGAQSPCGFERLKNGDDVPRGGPEGIERAGHGVERGTFRKRDEFRRAFPDI